MIGQERKEQAQRVTIPSQISAKKDKAERNHFPPFHPSIDKRTRRRRKKKEEIEMKAGEFLENVLKIFASRLDRDTASSESKQKKEEDLKEIAIQEQKQFSLQTLCVATQDFHPKQKLGEGGFGPVYKGKLEDGSEIAVKKLSRRSNQGRKEFMNEAMLLSRVQHRNVVHLLGYCAHGADKLLVYEYVANESLDKFLFKDEKRGELDWKRRYDVMTGVARGLLYLHEGSHCCIIHRDIKASNILLDDNWVPKIADFGTARLFPENQIRVNTRVAGTNGYMAPEYAMHGHLSVKADVFSFGVLVLELISGKRNLTFNNVKHDAKNLLQWAWKLNKKGQGLEIMDPILASSAATDQVLMCIQIGLSCTQADPNLRPTMRRVVVMMSRKKGTLDDPMRPGYAGTRYSRRHRPSSNSSEEPFAHAVASPSASTSNPNLASPITLTESPTNPTLTASPRSPSYQKYPLEGSSLD